MERDAFNELISIFRDEGKFYNEPSFFIGKITSSLPNLKVVTKGIELDKDSLKIDKFLLDRHNISISCDTGGISHNLNDRLNVGDSVILLRNENTFILISKVVSVWVIFHL